MLRIYISLLYGCVGCNDDYDNNTSLMKMLMSDKFTSKKSRFSKMSNYQETCISFSLCSSVPFL